MGNSKNDGCGTYIYLLIIFFAICALLNAMF